jgi:hypothetical protein
VTKKPKTIKQYDTEIKRHIKKKDYVKIKRTVTEGSADISGFILQMSSNFILIQKEEEFYLDGYGIIKKDHFDALRCNKFERAFKRILKAEGIFDSDYGFRKKLKLTDWKTILEDLMKHDYHVIVECEDMEDPLFVIGPIKKVSKDSVDILYYDPTGLLDQKPTKVKYKDITLIKFDNRYINVFKKYLRTK